MVNRSPDSAGAHPAGAHPAVGNRVATMHSNLLALVEGVGSEQG